MKKNYLKPDAEFIAFYSDEDIAAVLPLENYANEGSGGVLGGSVESGDAPEGWDYNALVARF